MDLRFFCGVIREEIFGVDDLFWEGSIGAVPRWGRMF